ncbi:MAG: hypothetical protein AB1651_18345 [Pseudomonadota bacterium]
MTTMTIAEMEIGIKQRRDPYTGAVSYIASACETATDYCASLGTHEAGSISAALHGLVIEMQRSVYAPEGLHRPDEAVPVAYYPAAGGIQQCSTSLIDWTYARASRVADKLMEDR